MVPLSALSLVPQSLAAEEAVLHLFLHIFLSVSFLEESQATV
jgi:hypothetical protein